MVFSLVFDFVHYKGPVAHPMLNAQRSLTMLKEKPRIVLPSVV